MLWSKYSQRPYRLILNARNILEWSSLNNAPFCVLMFRSEYNNKQERRDSRQLIELHQRSICPWHLGTLQSRCWRNWVAIVHPWANQICQRICLERKQVRPIWISPFRIGHICIIQTQRVLESFAPALCSMTTCCLASWVFLKVDLPLECQNCTCCNRDLGWNYWVLGCYVKWFW